MSYTGPTLVPEDLPQQGLLYTDGDHLYVETPNARDHKSQIDWNDDWTLPVWSPDGSKMAFFSLNFGGLLKLKSDVKATLNIRDENTGETFESEEFAFDNVSYLGIRQPWVNRPEWISSTSELLVADKKGIYAVSTVGEAELLVETSAPTSLTVVDSTRFAYISKDSCYLYDIAAGEQGRRSLRGCGGYHRGKPDFGFSRSPDGRRLAFGSGKYLYVAGTDELSFRRAAELPEPIHDVRWVSNAGELLVLCGFPNSSSTLRGVGKPVYQLDGRYRLYVVGVSGEEPRLVYADPGVDVKSVLPSVSEDGRFVVLRGFRKEAIIVATDGSGSRKVGLSHRCKTVIWNPQ